MPAGSESSIARPTLAYARTGSSTAKASIASSVLRRLGVPGAEMVVLPRRREEARSGGTPLDRRSPDRLSAPLLRSKVLTW